MISKTPKQGQYGPKREIPQPEPVKPGTFPYSSQRSSQATSHKKPSPLPPPMLSDEAQRQVEAIIGRAVKALAEAVYPAIIELRQLKQKPYTIKLSPEADTAIKAFQQDTTSVEALAQRIEGVQKAMSKNIKSILWTFAGVVTFCVVIAFGAGIGGNNANHLNHEAAFRIQQADSLARHAKAVIEEQDIKRDYGEWMLQRYGTKSPEYRLFLRQRKK